MKLNLMSRWAAAGNGALLGLAWAIATMTNMSMHDTSSGFNNLGPIGWVIGAVVAGALVLLVARNILAIFQN
jgi:hypothetical protein